MGTESVCLLIGLIVGIIIGAICAFMLSLQRIVGLQKELRQATRLDDRFKDSFKILAQQIIDEKEEKLKQENQENLGEILKPFESNIKEFKEKVEATHQDNVERSAKIVEKISTLERMNIEMTRETDKLARALKGDNKFQGDWGEVVLETLLDKSGLIEGEEYYKQGKDCDTTNEDGINMKPDYIVKLPEDKCLVIDSKVSLKAYNEYLEAETDEDRRLAMANLTTSIKNHITGLANKDYTNLKINTPKFVLMFMPVEGAYTAALQYDRKIFDYATDKNIMVVTPTTLLPSLWLVSYIWKGEKQTKNAMEMARQTGLLYDKIVTFIDSFEMVGASIDRAKGIYDRAYNTLKKGKGNIVSKAENIRRLGASNTKMLSKEIIREATNDVLLNKEETKEMVLDEDTNEAVYVDSNENKKFEFRQDLIDEFDLDIQDNA
ncbi:MAG: DNA recombination protein RmuC [Clostridia bacterium]|nr:DNA recombination protein RmuC [Clostridia bacterium]